jgi:Protein of unknown function (DUF1999)
VAGHTGAMRYREFMEDDYQALMALDQMQQTRLDPAFAGLPEREQTGRLRTSLAALRFYQRSEHSFVAVQQRPGQDDPAPGDPAQEGQLMGAMLAQSVWMGDKPIILVTATLLHDQAPADTASGLLHAVVKSAYDAAVYEVHFEVTPLLESALHDEGAHLGGRWAVRHLGSRNATAPGEVVPGGAYTDAGRTGVGEERS